MYIYLYTGPQLRLRKARSQRVTVPKDFSVSVGRGELEGGWDPDALLHARPGLANQCKSELVF